MLKQRRNDNVEQQSLRRFNARKQGQRDQVPQKKNKISNIEEKENVVDRLQYIRRKYSSKDKDQNPKVFEHTKNYLQAEQYKPKDQVREQSKSYIRQSYKDITKQSQKQIYQQLQVQKYNPRLRSALQQKMLQPKRQGYSYYKGLSIPKQANQQINHSNIKSISNFEPSIMGSSSYTRSTSVYLGHRQVDKSCDKISKRVQNINKINERIKYLLSGNDMGQISRLTQFKKETINVREKPIVHSSFSNVKLFEQKVSDNLKIIESIQFNESNQQKQTKISLNSNILQKLSTLQIQNYESEHIVQPVLVKDKVSKQTKEKSKVKSKEIENLMYKLSIQIQHDENLRTSKYFFLLSTQSDKYDKLLNILSLKGTKYSPQKLKEIMKFTQQEYNPFICEPAHEDYNRFADTIIASNDYWEKNIYKKFSYQKLKNEKIDQILVFENKDNQLLVSDLVRFVNLGSGNLYKNRDLVLIARKISQNENQLSVQKIFRALSNFS